MFFKLCVFLGSNPNPCSTNNGGCSHFCLLLNFHPWSECSCPVGIKLLDDGRTCDPRGIDKVSFGSFFIGSSSPSTLDRSYFKILFISAVSGLYHISLDTNDFTPKQVLFEVCSVPFDGVTIRVVRVSMRTSGPQQWWICSQVLRHWLRSYRKEDLLDWCELGTDSPLFCKRIRCRSTPRLLHFFLFFRGSTPMNWDSQHCVEHFLKVTSI